MNYIMQGITETIPKLFVMLKSTKVEIKKKHQVLMVDKTTSFKKRAKGRRGTSRRTASKLLLEWRSPSLDLNLRLSASTGKDWSLEAELPQVFGGEEGWQSKQKYICIHVIDVYFPSVHSSPWVFDTGSVAMISNSKQELQNEQRLVEDEVTMCVGNDSKGW